MMSSARSNRLTAPQQNHGTQELTPATIRQRSGNELGGNNGRGCRQRVAQQPIETDLASPASATSAQRGAETSDRRAAESGGAGRRDTAASRGRRKRAGRGAGRCGLATVHWHLKQIYQKLPISRQVDLVRLVLSIAEFG